MNASFSLRIATALAVFPAACHAYLGGFEAVDGYEDFLNDVATYNAGQYGPNAGGGTYVNIPDNTGLWTKLQGPLWPTLGLAGVGLRHAHLFRDRTTPGSPLHRGLVITTNADGWTAGPQEYAYQLDSFDLGGVSPAATGGDTLDISFWSCSLIFGTSEGGGLGAGTIGNTVPSTTAAATSASRSATVSPAPRPTSPPPTSARGTSRRVDQPSTYHRWDVTLDLGAQTVTIDIFESGVLTNLATNAPLITPMADFTSCGS